MMFTVHTAYEVFDTWFVLVLSLSCAAFASIHALLTKPDPRGAFGWMVICWLFPLGGAILYGLFGINRVRTRARRLRGDPANETPTVHNRTSQAPEDHLMRIGDVVTQWSRCRVTPLTYSKTVRTHFRKCLRPSPAPAHGVAGKLYLRNRSGRTTVHQGAGGCDLARRPGPGTDRWRGRMVQLAACGARAAPRRSPKPAHSAATAGSAAAVLNMRNHRKLLLVDGETGFLGGMNIGGREVGRSGVRSYG